MIRRLFPSALLAVLIAVFLLARLGATAAVTSPKGPAPNAAGPDGVGFLGQVMAVSPHRLVLNDGRHTHTVALGPMTKIANNGPRVLHVGTPVFVGAHEVDGRLVARVVEDLSDLQINQGPVQKLQAILKHSTPHAGQSTTGSSTTGNCSLNGGFDPTGWEMDFPGCLGYPSLTIAPQFTPLQLINVLGFQMYVTSFNMTLATSGGFYEFPFNFTATDVATEQYYNWVGDCLDHNYNFTTNPCPYPRPAVPGPGQPRTVAINVTPVGTGTVPSFQFTAGAFMAVGFQFDTATGCGKVGLDPCTYNMTLPLASPLSTSSQTNAAPPLAPGSTVRVPPLVCTTIGFSLDLPPLVGKFLSPFDTLVCDIFYIDPPINGGMATDVAATDGSKGDTDRGTYYFDGTTQDVTVTPDSQGNASVDFSGFQYTAQEHLKMQLKFRQMGGVIFAQTPELGDITQWVNFITPSSSGYDGGLTPTQSISVPVQYAPIAATTVKDFAPQAADSAGGTVIKVDGNAFNPVSYQGTPIPGSGVTAVDICQTSACDSQGDVKDIPFKILSNTSLDIYPPAHAPSFSLVQDQYGEWTLPAIINHDVMVIHEWGTTIDEDVFYAPPPIITSLKAETKFGTFEAPESSSNGGTTYYITGYGMGRVTGVQFGNTPASFAQCGVGQADSEYAVCASEPGLVIATAPAHAAGSVYVHVQSACFGNVYTNIVCGTSQDLPGALMTYKAAPTLTALSRTGGLPAGGDQITLSGSGFGGGDAIVHFGNTDIYCNQNCTNVTDSSLTLTVPAGTVGTSVPVTVENACPNTNGTACGTSQQLFYQYVGAPTLTAMTPSSGAYSGGTQVEIEGSGFTTATEVDITMNGKTAVVSNPTILSDSYLGFTTPISPTGFPGTTSITVVTDCGASAPNPTSCGTSNALAFDYTNNAQPLATTIAPDPVVGPAGGAITLRATLSATIGVLLPNRTVSFSVQGSNVGTATTDGTGVATLTVPVPSSLASGVYPGAVSATFGGDPIYAASQASTSLTLKTPDVVEWGQGLSSYSVPPAPGLLGVKAITAGFDDVLALMNDGTVVAWGAGDGAKVPAGLSNVVQVSAEDELYVWPADPSAALRADGSVVVWGTDSYQQSMLPPSNLPPLTAISVGGAIIAGVTQGGSAVVWGDNTDGETTIPAAAQSNVVAVAAGFKHVLALKSDGTVVAWGDDKHGQTNVPAGLSNVVAVAAGQNGSLALLADGTVVAWGADGNGYPLTVPASINTTGVKEIHFGDYPTARLADGSIVQWTGSSVYTLGYTPVPQGLSPITAYAVGGADPAFGVGLIPSSVGTTLSVSPVSGSPSTTQTLTATLKSGAEPLQNETVVFSLNGVEVGSAATDSAGTATLPNVSLTNVPHGTYPAGVKASFAGDSTYAAVTATASLTVSGQSQTITFGTLANQTFGDPSFQVSATATSGLAVSFTASGACTVANSSPANGSGTVTLTGAGSCTITASQAGNATYDPAQDVSQTFTIGKAVATVNVTGYTGAYDGQAHGATGTATGVNGADLSSELTLGSTFTDAPGGTADWTFNANNSDPNYTAQSGSVKVTITPAAAIVNVTGYTGTYDGQAHGATGTATGANGADLSSELTLGSTFTNAPGGTATWTFNSGTSPNPDYAPQSGSVKIAITPAVATVNVTGYTGTYDGKAHGATGTATGINGVDLSSELTLGSTFTDAPGGTATWTFNSGTSPNPDYAPQSGSVKIAITPAVATVNVTGYTGTYDAQAHGATGTATGINGADLSSELTFGSTFTDAPGGTADWTFNSGTTPNPDYAPQSGSVKIAITPAVATVNVTGYTGTYDAKPHGATGTATGVNGADLSSELTLGSTFTDAPGGTATWTFNSGTTPNPDYTAQSGSATITITPAVATVNVTGYTGTYDAKAHGATGTATGVNGVDLSSELNLGSTFTDYPGGAADWTFNSGTSPNPDYTAQSGSVKITINKAVATVNVTGYTGTYDAKAHGATGTATGVNGVDLSSGLNLGSTFTNYPGGTADWTFTGGTNYTNQSGTATITINKAVATVNVTGYTGTYDAKPHGATGTATGVNGVNLSSGLNLGSTFTNYPGGTADWTFTGGTNYTNQTGTAVIAIAKAPLVITALPASMVYGGTFPTLTVAYQGFVNGETANVLLTPPAVATSATPASGVGTYPITVGGATARNYAISYRPGLLTITPAALTITATDQSKWVGAANPTLTVAYAGFVNHDTAASLTTPVTVTTTATLLSPSGTYPITVSGATDPNYTITFVNGTLTVVGLQSVVQGVRTTIAGLNPTGNRELAHELAEALREIDASLQTRLWLDDSHLTARGQFVFETEREAVSELTEHEIARHAPATLVSQLATQAALLVKLNRALAELPLEEATAAGVEARWLTDPTQDIAAGDTQATKPGGGDEAIQHYRDAWQDVQRAVRAFTRDADRDGDQGDHATGTDHTSGHAQDTGHGPHDQRGGHGRGRH